MTDESIFTSALDIPDSAGRAAYLDSACADDPARRARVERLLAAADKAGSFLERPAAGRPDPAMAATRTLGDSDSSIDSVEDALGFLQPSPRAGALGRIGHYDVLEVLGRGGFGVVFRAFDDTLQRVVAVKVLSPQMAATSPARKRFLREARSSAAVRHENVVQIYNVSHDDERLPYLVMEFIPGETLQQRLDRTGPLEIAETVRVARQLAEGLAAAHATGLIHRDVKPANVLIERGPQERAKLTDFGLARAADDASISQSGIVAGTPMYMAPEQAKGEQLDHRADLFSLGSVLYVMCSGRPPFRASGTMAVLKRVCDEQPRPIREIIPEVPEWLCRIVEKLHAKNPADRFQTAREVADLLADCEKQLAAHKEVKDTSRIPTAKAEPASLALQSKAKWLFATACLVMLGAFASFVVLFEKELLGQFFWLPVVFVGLSGALCRAAVRNVTLALEGSADHETRLQSHKGVKGLAHVPAGKARLRSRPWQLMAGSFGCIFGAAVAGATLWTVLLVGTFGARYANNRGEVEFTGSADPDVEKVLVRRNGERIATLDRSTPRVTLAPGDYELEAVCIDGYEAAKFHVDTKRLYTASGSFERVEGRPIIRLTIRRGDFAAVAVTAERRTAPPGSPAQPRPVAELLAIIAGSWKCEYEVVTPKLSPQQARFVGYAAFEPVAGGWIYSGRTNLDLGQEILTLYGHDPKSGAILRFRFTPDGLVSGPAVGVTDTAQKSLSYIERLPDGNTSFHLFELTSPDVVKSRLYTQDANNAIISETRITFTRPTDPVSVPDLPTDPKRPEQMKVLDRLVGQWRNEVTVKTAATSRSTTESWRVTARPVVAGRFIEVIGTNEAGAASDYAVVWFDAAANRFRQWYFNSDGHMMSLSGNWDPAASALTWETADKTKTGRWGFKPDGTREFAHLVNGANGKVQIETTGVARRIAPDGPPVAVTPFEAAKAKELQERWAKHLGVPVEATNSIGMKLRLIPPGEFQMGSTAKEIEELLAGAKETEKFLVKSEGPQRAVRISSPYYMGTFEVTQAEYLRVMGANPSEFSPTGKLAAKVEGIDTDRFPVENVSWDDAMEFCRRLSELPAERVAGREYRLATEAQWEYACRAGTVGRFHTGDSLKGTDANFDLALGRPTTVGSFPANAFGLYDMHGNVFEWCRDSFALDYRDLPTLDPQGATGGDTRVVRGGNYGYRDRYCRSAARDRFQPIAKRGGIGFRVVIVGDLKPKPASPAPAGGPQFVTLRKFDPAKDKPTPLWANAKSVTVEDGAWRIENDTNMGNFKVLFDTILDGIPKDGLIVFRAKVKVKANSPLAWGSIQLGIGDPSYHKYDWPNHLGTYYGDVTEWTQKEIRYPASVFHQKNPPQIPVYVGLNANGVVWVKDAEVLHIPEGTKPEPVKATGPVKLRSFDPAKDNPVVLVGVGVKSLAVEGGALRIETGGDRGFNLILGEVVDGVPKDGLFVFRAKVKVKTGHKDSWGELQLNSTDPSSHGYDWPTERYRYFGDVSEWTQKEIRYPAAIFHKKNPPTVTMSAGLHEGVLWLKDIELWYVPEGAKLPPLPVAPLDAAQAKQLQEQSARTLGAPVEVENSVGMKFRFVPPGKFLMGSPDTEPDRRADREGPRHAIEIARPYYLGAYEVTQEQYRTIVGQNPSHFTAANKGGPNHPVETVNYAEAVAFCRMLSELPAEKAAGRTYRLPTEAEWEYACRAGAATAFAHADDAKALDDYAWTRSNAKTTQPVGQLKPNAWGLFDMHGNVFEICADQHDYVTGKPGRVPPTTMITRGGSWHKFATDARCAYRGDNDPKNRYRDVGFRVVCEVTAKPATPPGAVVPFDAKKAEEHQEAWAKAAGTKVEFADKKVGIEFRVIPPGDFQMGAKDAEIKDDITKAEDNKNYGWRLHVRSLKAETPQHPVRITRPFAIGKYEVTVGQFRKFIEATGYKTEAEQAGGYGVKDGQVVWGQKYRWNDVGYAQADNAPVWNISSGDAIAFCKWLSEKDGRTFRLPTEAEWEWACRAGTATRTFWDGEKAADAHKFAWGSAKAGRTPQPIGKLATNAFGLHDMCGNVWEWCSDWYNETYYKDSPAVDPTGPLVSGGGQRTRRRVQRGGGVDYNHLGLSSTARPVDDHKIVGFRVVCEIAGDLKLPPPPNAKEPPPVAALVPLREAVAAQEKARDDVKRRVEAGTASGIDLAVAEATLVEARIRVAEEEQNPEDVADLLEELVTHRQTARDRIALRVKEGVDPPANLTAADAKLADAKARLFKLRPPEAPPGAVVPFDKTKAEAHQGAWAKFLNTKVEFADPKLGMEFRVIPPGDFQMGAKDTEIKDDITKAHQNMPPGWQLLVRSLQAETPRHPVRITRPFAIGKYEVTVGQFKKFIEATGHKTDVEQAGGYGVKDGAVVWGKDYSWKNVGYPQADNAPVWNISRDDAVAFCKWLSKETGQTFRLPTEAEWEWACRAGTATRTFWDAEKQSDSLPYAWGSNKTGRKPQPVGGLKPNAFGLHDTCGNVWEWCSDWFSETYYTESAKNPLLSDPTGPTGPDGAEKTRHRVQRGGGVQGGHFGMSSTARSVHNQEVVGFRVVCEFPADVKLPPPEPKKPEPPEVAPEPHAPAPR